MLLLYSAACYAGGYEITGNVSLTGGYSSSGFAPFYVASNRHGVLTQAKDALVGVSLKDSLDRKKRFDFAWEVEGYAGISNSVDYLKWNPATSSLSGINPQRPASIFLQQLYAEIKWRSIMLSVGMKSRGSRLVDDDLSGGDLVWSGNARGIPEVRIGFVDFQPIPFTRGGLEIDACLSYGKFIDTDWINNHFSFGNGKINPGGFWTYKRLYLQTKPTLPFSARFGFQMTGIFGGHTYTYIDGVMRHDENNYYGIKDFFYMLAPFGSGREGYKTGDHKGSWDISLRYRFHQGSTLRLYTQFFWEDGTGMSKSNGWDGLYGIEFRMPGKRWLSGAVVEFLEFMNQSGDVNFYAPDFPATTITDMARGRDSYYNNGFYRSYVNYGMTIGTPFVLGSIYNLDGCPTLPLNRVRAIHVAADGYISPTLKWRAKYSHRHAKGMPNTMELIYPHDADSWLVGAEWQPRFMHGGFSFSADVAGDIGKLPSNAFGAYISAAYNFNIPFKKKRMAGN